MIGGRRIAQWSEATRDAFRKSRLARDVSVLGGATLGAQALGVLFTPIVTRLYDSAAFGMFAIFSSYLVVGATVVGLHFDLLIPSADSDGEAAALGASALIASVAVSALATAAYAALILLEGSSFAMLPLWSALPMGVLLVVSGWTLAARYLCIRQKQNNFSVN